MRATPRARNDANMKKESEKAPNDELREEYDLSTLEGGIRGKYYANARAGTNLVLIDPDLAELFPDGESVNRALRLLVQAGRAATGAEDSPKR
ncbi:MAG: hypothetical protein ABI693_08945 [Bryobacteraceae bacterium]